MLSIVGRRVALGPLRKGLLPLYGRWHNDIGAAHMLGYTPGPVTADEEPRWYEGQVRADDGAFFTVYERETLRPVDGTNLFGIVIGEPGFRGKGLGTETAILTPDHAFTTLGLRDVLLTVFEFNPAGTQLRSC